MSGDRCVVSFVMPFFIDDRLHYNKSTSLNNTVIKVSTPSGKEVLLKYFNVYLSSMESVSWSIGQSVSFLVETI